MNNTPIQQVKSHVHLGLTVEENCSWQLHIDNMLAKAWKRIDILRALKFQLDRKSLETMYFSYIRPILEYADIVWGNCNHQQTLDLEKVQTEAARIVTGATKSASSQCLANETKWDSLSCRRYKHRMQNMYNIVHGLSPSYLQNLLPQATGQTQGYNLRSNLDMHPPHSRTNIYMSSFFPTAIREWNLIPDHIRSNPIRSYFLSYLNRNKSNSPNIYYYCSQRRAQVLHTRLRLGCSSLNHHLFNNHVSETSRCSCGDEETIFHYIYECRKYDTARVETIARLGTNFSIMTLLHGDPNLTDEENRLIFYQVQNYIIRTGRF